MQGLPNLLHNQWEVRCVALRSCTAGAWYHKRMNENETYDVIIIGGGAAGLAAAISAAWKCRVLSGKGVAGAGEGAGDASGSSPVRSGADGAVDAATGVVAGSGATAAAAACSGANARSVSIALFEADDRVGRSILATGNGRCNFSNAVISSDLYQNAAFVGASLAALEEVAFWPRSCPPSGQQKQNAVLDFFANLGLCWREEGEGRLFPITGKASTVLDVLRAAAQGLGVKECCNMRVRSVEPPRAPGKPYTLRMADGSFQRAHQVICAVGGAVARELLPGDLPYAPARPVLGPLKTDTRDIRALDNIRVRCWATLERDGAPLAQECGEVLFRKYGLSGIAIFNLSRIAQPGDTVALDLFPNMSRDELQSYLHERAAATRALSGREATCRDVTRGMMLPLVAEALLKTLKLRPEDPVSAQNMHRLSRVAKCFKVAVEGAGDPKQCQVHRGGFSCEAFDATTMECKQHAGLFAAGEMLDVDAPCGGYNLHWAWASGALAGISAAAAFEGRRKAR